jgi:RNA 3'-terminal phosphate cyclase (ATP)
MRAGRDKPGLQRQHLTAVRAAAEIGAAAVDGDELGSQSLRFQPTTVRTGCHTFSVGTAGSATLVVQTVLPALLIAPQPTELLLEGGTHNPWAPPFEFLAHAYFPLINRMGPRVTTALQRHGFFPAGGGRFTVKIEPAAQLAGFELLQRGSIVRRCVTALVANLPRQIGERETAAAAEKLGWPPSCFHVDSTIESVGPGNVLLIEVHSEHVSEVFTGFGRLGTRAERVAQEAVDEVSAYLASDAPVGPYLADQLLLPLGIAAWQTGRGGSFRTLPLTRHTTTHIDLLREFLGIPIQVEVEAHTCRIQVGYDRSRLTP